MLIFLVILIRSKVLVIDDLNLTKRIAADSVNKKILKTITEKVSKGNEEVVLYNEKSDLRMSSKDYGINGATKEDCFDRLNENSKRVEIDIPVIEQSNLANQIKRYEDSVNELKNLVNSNMNNQSTKTALEKLREQRIQNLQQRVNSASNYANNLREKGTGFYDSNVQNIDSDYRHSLNKSTLDRLLSTSFDESLKKTMNDTNSSGSNFNSQNGGSAGNMNNSFLSGVLGYPDANYLNKNSLNNPNLINNSNTNKEYGSNQNLYNLGNDITNLNQNNKIPSNSFNGFNNSSGISGGPYDNRLAYTKAKIEDSLYKAIANRKEYINIKLQEIKINKDKLQLEIRSYKEKVAELLVKIRRIQKTKDSIVRKIADNKNHIINLNKNSQKVAESKEQVFSLIRITRNEVLRYKNLLENETNKLGMLEKQYEVYEDTLKKYSEDIEQESNKLYRSSNELNKNTIDLENVESLYREYTEKNKQIEEDLMRYEKIADCLDTEEKKISRNQLSGLII
jgi:DNA repair exonuclease SbcCD ATPase subunit